MTNPDPVVHAWARPGLDQTSDASDDVARRSRVIGVAVCIALLAVFAVTGWTAWLGKSATFDEPLHLTGAWLQTHYGDFRCNPEDPPLWKYYVAVGTKAAALPIIRNVVAWPSMLRQMPSPAYFYSRHALYQTPAVDADSLIRAGRARMLALGVLLGAAIAWWGWRLGGPVAGIVAVSLFCFDPNFLAHAALIKNDVAITAAFVLFMGAVWLAGEKFTLWRGLAVAVLLGVCLTVKFSGILAIPMLLLAMACRVCIGRPWPVLKWSAETVWMRLAATSILTIAALIFSYGFIWASYGFRFGPTPNPSLRFDFKDVTKNGMTNEMVATRPSSQTGVLSDDAVRSHEAGRAIQWTLWANKRHLLPQSYLMGFLYTYSTSLVRKTFLCGEIQTSGSWYYFPLAVIFKTPLATLAALGLAVGVFAFAGSSSRGRDWIRRYLWSICALGIAPVLYAVVATHSNLNIGIRHFLPVYPFCFIAVGVAATIGLKRWKRSANWVLIALASGLILETYQAYPDYIPFFNAAVGGSRGGLSLLSDSNIDWGQELPALATWQRAHPESQIFLFYFGVIDPHYYRLKYVELPGSNESVNGDAPDGNLRPVFAVSAVALQGTYLSREHAAFYARLRAKQPIAVLGGSIYLYDGLQMAGPSREEPDMSLNIR
jgi:hypothetical protein